MERMLIERVTENCTYLAPKYFELRKFAVLSGGVFLTVFDTMRTREYKAATLDLIVDVLTA